MYESEENIRDLRSLLEIKAFKNKEKLAIACKDIRITYAQLNELASRVASYFSEIGIGKSSKVATMLFNCPEFLYVWFGLSKLGAVHVPLNTALKGEILLYELEDSDAEVVVIDSILNDRYAAIRSDLKKMKHEVYHASQGHEYPEGMTPFGDLLKAPRFSNEVEVGPSDPASILYTSGTTGPPKGVVIPHFNYIMNGLEFSRLIGVREGDVLFTALPLFHCNAQHLTTMGALLNDLTAAYADWFSASGFWKLARKYDATVANLLISMINVLYKQPEDPDDRNHRVRVAASAGTSKEIWEAFERRFSVKIVELYGMTEAGCGTIMNPFDRVKIGSIGLPMRFVEAKVVNEFDEEVPTHTKGELAVRPRIPYTMMIEYYKKPDETNEAWRRLWLHTGDYVYKDEEGYFYFVDRMKDIIRRRGENIAPYDVENALNAHPKVLESVAVGVPSELGEEDVKAYVKLKPAERLEPLEIVQWCAERLPFFMVPRYIEILDEIPKTANQKAQRFLLRQMGIGKAFDREKVGYKLTTQLRKPYSGSN